MRERSGIWPGNPYPLGATFDGYGTDFALDGYGTNFALFSEVAENVELVVRW